MEQPLFVLVSLALVSFCRGLEYPQYQVVATNQDFEERLYGATEWITTKVESSSQMDLVAAHSTLKSYCKRQNDAGYHIPDDTWPVLITVTDDQDLSLSWFIPQNTAKPENPDPSVTFQSRPAATVYVRVFDKAPSKERGQENAAILREALVKAGKTFDSHTYSGASYDPIWSFIHHNEIWIYSV